ncbi:hypothetical protein BC628DRAFT_1367962 [Trametes gibbosa]|nr:hypothetical protein BC628DRAFT_1367962 [Trametes gibbosa]
MRMPERAGRGRCGVLDVRFVLGVGSDSGCTVIARSALLCSPPSPLPGLPPLSPPTNDTADGRLLYHRRADPARGAPHLCLAHRARVLLPLPLPLPLSPTTIVPPHRTLVVPRATRYSRGALRTYARTHTLLSLFVPPALARSLPLARSPALSLSLSLSLCIPHLVSRIPHPVPRVLCLGYHGRYPLISRGNSTFSVAAVPPLSSVVL